MLGVWGNIPWKYELNPFSGLGRDVMTSLDNETKMHGQTKIIGVRENTALQCSKKISIESLILLGTSYTATDITLY